MNGSLARCEWQVELGLNEHKYKINNIFTLKPENSPNQPLNHIVIAKGDSAASHNYWQEIDQHCLIDIKQVQQCKIVLPNDTIVEPSKRGQLLLSEHLSRKAKDVRFL